MSEVNHNRRSIRLPGYDYTQPGAYFITVVTYARAFILGEITGETMRLSPIGEMVSEELPRLENRFAALELDEWVIMPNHVHILLILGRGTGDSIKSLPHIDLPRAPTSERFGAPVAGSIPTIVRSLKSSTTQRFIRLTGDRSTRLWQRNYYDRIIRTEDELRRARGYIQNNPLQWALDSENTG
ncbi:MAG TPA: hypothetical protein PLT26_03595 [Anaerolineaceae bacterium]|nr:hypothetical protein [Anaerolineaceae bacterium]HQH84140.1 hypothetical protein [Anaerolineaceae bacterium]